MNRRHRTSWILPVAILVAGIAAPTGAATLSYRGAVEVWVAASAHAPGAEATTWSTDLWVHAPGETEAVDVDVWFLPFGLGEDNLSDSPVRVTVPAGGQLALEDVLGTLFGVADGAGALRFRATDGETRIVVASRTFNDAATGTYGQLIGGVPESDALGAGSGSAAPDQQVIGLLTDDSYRANVGVVNVSPTGSATVSLELRRRSGELLGTLERVYPPWTAEQLNRVFERFGVEPENEARLVVRVTAGEGRVLAYASVVDNRTGDPVYLPGTSGQ